MTPANQLEIGLDALAIEASKDQQTAWLRHLDLLARWNKVHNLTRVADPALAVSRHLLDSLTVAPFIQPGTVLDVGTGGGFPGLPLAVLFPGNRFVLVDKSAKKASFVQQVAIDLQLTNVQVVSGRVEQAVSASSATQIVSRAFASLSDMLALTTSLLAEGGEWLAMKGQIEPAELEAVTADTYSMNIHPLQVPGGDAARHLVQIRRRH